MAPSEQKDPELLELEERLAKLHERGIDFEIEHGRVVTKAGLYRDRSSEIDLGKEHFRLGVISDSHGGSKFEQISALRNFYREADDREVDAFVHAGDWTQGPDRMHRDQYLGVHAHGADQQVEYVAATYPTSGRGAKTYAISGNHDDSFLNEGGVNVVRQIAARRSDITYVGQDAAYLTIGGLRMYVIHPDGGGSYAKSYKPQKVAESLPANRPVSLILIGHYHQFGIFKQKDALVVMLPCFQSQYSWLARKALYPDIGGIVLDVWLDDKGRPARVTPELISYEPIEDDWDHEASSSVHRSWSSRGLEE